MATQDGDWVVNSERTLAQNHVFLSFTIHNGRHFLLNNIHIEKQYV